MRKLKGKTKRKEQHAAQDDDPIITREEAAVILGVGPERVRQLAQDQILQVADQATDQPNRNRLFRRSAVIQLRNARALWKVGPNNGKMTPKPQGDLSVVGAKQASVIIGVTSDRVRQMARKGDLPFIQEGKGPSQQWQFKLKDVERVNASRQMHRTVSNEVFMRLEEALKRIDQLEKALQSKDWKVG